MQSVSPDKTALDSILGILKRVQEDNAKLLERVHEDNAKLVAHNNELVAHNNELIAVLIAQSNAHSKQFVSPPPSFEDFSSSARCNSTTSSLSELTDQTETSFSEFSSQFMESRSFKLLREHRLGGFIIDHV